MEHRIIEEEQFKYLESEGGEEVLLLLHGLFGALSNFQYLIQAFESKYNVVIPLLPIMEMPIKSLSLGGLVNFVDDFVEFKNFKKVHVLGNSLGGHIGLYYTKHYPQDVAALVLTGSSGLYEKAMGDSFPKRGNYEYITEKTRAVFYDPEIATKELVDDVFEIVNDRNSVIRTLSIAKSAIRHNMANDLPNMKQPTCIIWGKQDNVTPPEVAEDFHKLVSSYQLWLLFCWFSCRPLFFVTDLAAATIERQTTYIR